MKSPPEAVLAQVLDALPVAVAVVDLLGRFRVANQQAIEILGPLDVYAGITEGPGQYDTFVVGTELRYPPERLPLVRALRGERAHATDIEIRRGDRSIPVEAWAAPVFDGEGRIAFAVAAFHDIREHEASRRQIERLNDELARRVMELEVANQELETFSYSVSHDLRAPLRGIDGFCRILVEDHAESLPSEAQRQLEVIRERTQHMGKLIDDLLRLSRVTRKGLELARVDMNVLLRSALTELDPRALERTRMALAPLPPVVGDAALLKQAWVNLLSNAIKYSAPRADPTVEIKGQAEGGEILFFVRDNGVGFDMTYADKLFGVFQRLHRRDEFEGTGIGLAIVQRVVHRHGGRVWAMSTPEGGATFFFTLPKGGRQ